MSDSFTIDDDHEFMSPVCGYRKHADRRGEQRCAAFPEGVADEIWEGENDHTAPFPDDNGIQFEFADDMAVALAQRWSAALGKQGATRVDKCRVSYQGQSDRELFGDVTALIADGRQSEVPPPVLAAYRETMTNYEREV